jgi:hypothetical protein
VRAAVVLALAPILAVGLFLGARTMVSDKPAPQSGRATSVVWSGRVFKTKAQLARWLDQRDMSYDQWAAQHPGASFFREAPAPKASKPKPAHPSKAPASSPSASGLLRLLVIGLLVVFGVALTAGAVRLAGGLVATRRQASPFAGVAAGGDRRQARLPPPEPPPRQAPTPSGVSQQLERAKIYAPPRVMPNINGRASVVPVARAVPLYLAPDPEAEVAAEPEPILIEASAARQTLPEPAAAPTASEVVVEPETAFPAPAQAVDPESAVVEAAAVAEAVPALEPAPEPPPAAPEPTPLPLPEPEPPLAPAADRPAPVPETPASVERPAAAALVPAATDVGVAELPDAPPDDGWALPEPAPPGAVWQECEVGLWQGYVKSQFYAGVTSPEGTDFTVAVSTPFRSKDPLAHDEI